MDKTMPYGELFVEIDEEQELKKAAAQARKAHGYAYQNQPLSVRAKKLHDMYAALDKIKHDMTLADEPFVQICDGVKTVEVRLLDEKRQKIKVGDIICFTRKDSTESLYAEVIALYRYQSFVELFSSPHFAKTGFVGLTPSEAANKMYEYYDKASEQNYGVLGIEIKVVSMGE